MRWWRGSNGRRAGCVALGLVAVMAQACLADERGVRCHDALDCPYGAQCTGHVCTLGPSVLRPGQHHDAGAPDAPASDGARDAAIADAVDLDAVPDGGNDALSADDAPNGETAAASGDSALDVADALAE